MSEGNGKQPTVKERLDALEHGLAELTSILHPNIIEPPKPGESYVAWVARLHWKRGQQ